MDGCGLKLMKIVRLRLSEKPASFAENDRAGRFDGNSKKSKGGYLELLAC
jgi:hypothetical protein